MSTPGVIQNVNPPESSAASNGLGSLTGASDSGQIGAMPKWAVIVIVVLAGLALVIALGMLMHRGGKSLRQRRAQRNLMEQDAFFNGPSTARSEATTRARQQGRRQRARNGPSGKPWFE